MIQILPFYLEFFILVELRQVKIMKRHLVYLLIYLKKIMHWQYFVGMCYESEYGVTKNEKLAFEYYEKVANKDYDAGQLDLGFVMPMELVLKKIQKWLLNGLRKLPTTGI
jgi:hypothetical protein